MSLSQMVHEKINNMDRQIKDKIQSNKANVAKCK